MVSGLSHVNIDYGQILHQELRAGKIDSDRLYLVVDALANHDRGVLA